MWGSGPSRAASPSTRAPRLRKAFVSAEQPRETSAVSGTSPCKAKPAIPSVLIFVVPREWMSNWSSAMPPRMAVPGCPRWKALITLSSASVLLAIKTIVFHSGPTGYPASRSRTCAAASVSAPAILSQISSDMWKDCAVASGKEPSCMATRPGSRHVSSCVPEGRPGEAVGSAAACAGLGRRSDCTNACNSDVLAPMMSQLSGMRSANIFGMSPLRMSPVENKKPSVGVAVSSWLIALMTSLGKPTLVTKDGRRRTSPVMRKKRRDTPASLLKSVAPSNSSEATRASLGNSLSGNVPAGSLAEASSLLFAFCAAGCAS
mmetsp:Transcript_76090/g.219755  ORF Transcript_76090/g.219755 Transcript_76090/m.219755 type:complete len:318 (+) Transcript_76090:260-1213(+)